MKSLRDIEKVFDDLHDTTNVEMDERILRDISLAMEGSGPAGVWRIVMRSKVIKFAAAAVVVMALVLSVILFDKTVTQPAYGFGDAIALLREAKTLHIRGWCLQQKYVDAFDTEVSGQLPTEYWYDFENGQYRYNITHFDWDGKLYVNPTICDGEYEISETSCRLTSGETFKAIEFKKVDKSKTGLDLLDYYGKLDDIEGSAIIGNEEINGIICDIWQVEIGLPVSEGGSGYKELIQVWISPATKEIERVKRWGKEIDGPWVERQEYSFFERDIPMAAELFVTDPPEGEEYRLENTKETAIDASTLEESFDIYDWVKFDCSPLTLRVFPVFRFNNGSFLACWQSVDGTEPHDLSKYFQNLKTGGDLPKLPLEVYAFSPMPNVRNMQFVGFHFASTKKETENGPRWYEWSLYVPDSDPPSPERVLYYRIKYRNNTAENKSIDRAASRFDWQEIESRQDFDSLVLKEISMRSDGGVVPEHITYENVLQLSEELRDSLTQQ